MPMKPPTPCTYSGCPRAAASGGRCLDHARERQAQYDATRGTASERGYGAAWRKLRLGFLRRNPECVACGADATEVDHITPRAQGGTDDEGNLQPMCSYHHKVKTATHDGGWGHRQGARSHG